MPESTNTKVFDAKDFKPENYVKKLVQECVGGSELQQRKSEIQSINDQTSSSLKKHVYTNYMQFIDTANEISHLESEMYQLSHLMIEQRNILSNIREEHAINDPNKSIIDEQELAKKSEQQLRDESNRKSITAIRESVQGYTGNLDGKVYLYEGSLIELDSNSYRPICRVYLFLFNDLLLLAKVKHDKKLAFAAEYETKKVAVINIKDLDGVKNAINIITPDGAKIFQCLSPTTKTEWIDKFEESHKFNQVPAKPKKNPAPQPPIRPVSESSSMSPDRQSIDENWAPDWILLAAEEIHTLIAQRHFEDAHQMIDKCERYFEKDSTFFTASEIINKIQQAKCKLSNVLLIELANLQCRSLDSVLRSSRRSLKLLAEMGKPREACSALLKVCTSAIRTSQRQARRNNLEISELFFCDLAQVACEFLKAFNNQAACISTLVVWCNTELQYFASQIIKHYFNKGTQLDVVAKCVESVRKPCAKLTQIGLDLSYHMDGLLRNNLEQIIEESRVRLIDTIGRTEDVWQPYNLHTKSQLAGTLKELQALGIEMKSQVTGDTWINLTQSIVNFCRHFLTVTEQCAILAKNESLKLNVEILLRDLFRAQYDSGPSPHITVDLNFVARNKTYLTTVLLPVAIKNFERTSGSNSSLLTELMMQLNGPPKPKPRSVYKTDVL